MTDVHLNIVIDPDAGVCPGVRRALKMVEVNLAKDILVAVGDVIHNKREINRLAELGLDTVDQNKVSDKTGLNRLKNKKAFIRSHGVAPELRALLESSASEIIDGTCGNVKKVQKLIEQFDKDGYQILVVGKANHPEVIGLIGHCVCNAVVLEEKNDLKKVRREKSVLLAQTTVSPEKFSRFRQSVIEQIPDVKVIDTTCPYIQKRRQKLVRFCHTVDVVLMVGGRQSSNTGILYELCQKVNSRSYRLESEDDIDMFWFRDGDTVGITGSASTPEWQLKKIADFIRSPFKGSK
ncbi:4-hydroxy-3-methylbut-2-enyl diphosphate reductase [candidate division KSB1 bacterium]|nr:4-hydroxy-3-methylbut-2-enyl diphosphate reductase [candidate division KSB1 bacterium]